MKFSHFWVAISLNFRILVSWVSCLQPNARHYTNFLWDFDSTFAKTSFQRAYDFPGRRVSSSGRSLPIIFVSEAFTNWVGGGSGGWRWWVAVVGGSNQLKEKTTMSPFEEYRPKNIRGPKSSLPREPKVQLDDESVPDIFYVLVMSQARPHNFSKPQIFRARFFERHVNGGVSQY